MIQHTKNPRIKQPFQLLSHGFACMIENAAFRIPVTALFLERVLRPAWLTRGYAPLLAKMCGFLADSISFCFFIHTHPLSRIDLLWNGPSVTDTAFAVNRKIIHHTSAKARNGRISSAALVMMCAPSRKWTCA